MEDFTEREVAIMDILKNHFALRMYQIAAAGERRADGVMSRLESFARASGLTDREREVLQLLYEGRSGKQICETLFITDSTLRKHVHNLYGKTGCRSRVQLISRLGEK